MKKSIYILISSCLSLVMVSCYPPIQPQLKTPADSPQLPPELTAEEIRAKAEADYKKNQAELNEQAGQSVQSAITTTPATISSPTTATLPPLPGSQVSTPSNPLPSVSGISPTLPDITPTPTTTKKNYPYARAVPGQSGFVFNPYTQTKIDVRGFSSGSLVSPEPGSDQKFYVP